MFSAFRATISHEVLLDSSVVCMGTINYI